MKGLFIMMVLVIIAFFLWIRYQLSIPGSGERESSPNALINDISFDD